MTVPSFFLKNGQLMTLCRWCRTRFSKLYVPFPNFGQHPNPSPWKVWEMLYREDRECWHVWRYVRGRIEIAFDDTSLSVGQFFGVVRQPNCPQRLEDIHWGWDFVGLLMWREPLTNSWRVLLVLSSSAHCLIPRNLSFLYKEERAKVGVWYARFQ